MAGYNPHKISHDHKYQSRGDFELKPKSKRESILSDATTLVDSSETSSEPLKKPESPKFRPLNPILDDEDIPPNPDIIVWIRTQQPRKIFPWVWLLIILIILVTILVPVLITKLVSGRGPVAGGLANSTANTVTVEVSNTTETETLGPTTVLVTQTLQITTATVSSSSSQTSSFTQPIVTAPIEGFSVTGFENGDIQLFYSDAKGNIQSMQYLQGVWSSPVAVASNAKIGTTLSISSQEYYDSDDYVATLWRIFYVDTTNILQEIRKTVTFGSSDSAGISGIAGTGWTTAGLGSYGFKVADSLYQRACTFGYSDSLSSSLSYLYFDTATGGITELDWFYSDSWQISNDLPELVSTSSKAIACVIQLGGSQYMFIENLWIVNTRGELEQWWLNDSLTNRTWNRGIHYSGSLYPNTSIYGISHEILTTVYFQAANNSIMQLSVSGETSTTDIAGVVAVGEGAPGTRIDITSLSYNETSFYLYFQNGSHLVQSLMEINNLTGEVALGGTFVSAVIFGNGVERSLIVLPLLILLCSALGLHLLL